jgi:hypothetical protein
MNRRLTRTALAGLLATGLSALLASTAAATFHENLIREVHEGGVAGDYVELQSYAAGQNFVSGKHIVSYDAGGGAPLTDYTIPSNVSNGANQATILVASGATPGADFPNVGAGATGLNVDNTGGTVCFTDSSITVKLDCVAFDGAGGADVTEPAGANFGTPFALPGANLDNQSLIRTISRGCATSLDTADDTNSAADFSLGAGSPRGNSATPTETLCPSSPSAPTPVGKKRCKKKKHRSAESAKKKKCKRKKHH